MIDRNFDEIAYDLKKLLENSNLEAVAFRFSDKPADKIITYVGEKADAVRKIMLEGFKSYLKKGGKGK